MNQYLGKVAVNATISNFISISQCTARDFTSYETNTYEAPVQMREWEWNICFLTKVQVEDVERRDEKAGCKVYKMDNGYWYLRAIPLESEQDTNEAAYCEATCFAFRAEL